MVAWLEICSDIPCIESLSGPVQETLPPTAIILPPIAPLGRPVHSIRKPALRIDPTESGEENAEGHAQFIQLRRRGTNRSFAEFPF